MIITPNFSLHEFKCHEGTPYPNKWVATRLRPLCELLEDIRDMFHDAPIKIVSGYRTPDYNKSIGGHENSQHMFGKAADISVKGVPSSKVRSEIKWHHTDGAFPMLHGLGRYDIFTHIDIRHVDDLHTWG